MTTSTRPVRPCLHKFARHEHGTRNAYVCDRCRCAPCTEAQRVAESARNRLKVYGRYDGLVDAQPVREHLLALSAAGIGFKTVTARTGVSGGQLCSIVYGRGSRGPKPRAPQRRCTPDVRDRVLSVQITDAPAPGSAIDGTGTRRRLQALVAAGWSQAKLAARLGMACGNFGKVIRGDRVLVTTAEAVRVLFDELWDQPPPQTGHRDKIAAARARSTAAGNGWLPALAWDDDTIDDPTAAPMHDTPDVGELDEIAVHRIMTGALRLPRFDRSPERIEAIRRLADRGMSDQQVANLVGASRDAVTKARERAGIASRVIDHTSASAPAGYGPVLRTASAAR